MTLKYLRATSNLKLLELVANKLGTLNKEVVYLGGAATALFITDPLSLDVRPTIDVDCIVDIISLVQYYQFEKEMITRGFKKSKEVICRWHHEDIILDVMPTDEKILGFGNPWYKEALFEATSHKINDNLIINSVKATYFLATKIEAFKTRGNNDLLGSHDFEDIISIIVGRCEIVDEIALSNANLRTNLKNFFENILKDERFELVLPGLVNEGPVTMQRVQTVKSRIKQIAQLAE